MLALATLWEESNELNPAPRSPESAPLAAVPAELPAAPLPAPDLEPAAEGDIPGVRRRKRQKTTLSSAFEDRLREGAQGFNFDALISTGNRPEPKLEDAEEAEQPASAAPQSPPTPIKVRVWRGIMGIGWVVFLVIRPVGRVLGGLVSGVGTALFARKGRRAFVHLTCIAILGFALIGGIQAYTRWNTTGRIGNVVLGANPNTLRSVPDPTLTPGEIKGDGEHGEIDVSVRRAVMDSYGVDPHDEDFVPVRLYPSELGGTNSAKNVFPATPFFAMWKARLDACILDLVRKGALKKDQALAELKIDWILAAHKYHVPDSVEIRLNRPKGK